VGSVEDGEESAPGREGGGLRPGDLVEVGKHRAREWIAVGDAEVWEIDTGAANPPTAGIACYGGVGADRTRPAG
jgi:hypothetical protein